MLREWCVHGRRNILAPALGILILLWSVLCCLLLKPFLCSQTQSYLHHLFWTLSPSFCLYLFLLPGRNPVFSAILFPASSLLPILFPAKSLQSCYYFKHLCRSCSNATSSMKPLLSSLKGLGIETCLCYCDPGLHHSHRLSRMLIQDWLVFGYLCPLVSLGTLSSFLEVRDSLLQLCLPCSLALTCSG